VRDIIGVMSSHSGFVVVALLIWAVAGPIGMAFDGCALTCDEPCALVTASISGPPAVPFISTVVGPVREMLRGHPIEIASSFEPPPRLALHSA
jgi:hypothetical protein